MSCVFSLAPSQMLFDHSRGVITSLRWSSRSVPPAAQSRQRRRRHDDHSRRTEVTDTGTDVHGSDAWQPASTDDTASGMHMWSAGAESSQSSTSTAPGAAFVEHANELVASRPSNPAPNLQLLVHEDLEMTLLSAGARGSFEDSDPGPGAAASSTAMPPSRLLAVHHHITAHIDIDVDDETVAASPSDGDGRRRRMDTDTDSRAARAQAGRRAAEIHVGGSTWARWSVDARDPTRIVSDPDDLATPRELFEQEVLQVGFVDGAVPEGLKSAAGARARALSQARRLADAVVDAFDVLVPVFQCFEAADALEARNRDQHSDEHLEKSNACVQRLHQVRCASLRRGDVSLRCIACHRLHRSCAGVLHEGQHAAALRSCEGARGSVAGSAAPAACIAVAASDGHRAQVWPAVRRPAVC